MNDEKTWDFILDDSNGPDDGGLLKKHRSQKRGGVDRRHWRGDFAERKRH